MINTLLLPEIREMLAQNNSEELAGFCNALHPARTAEFMGGLTIDETWAVLSHTDDENKGDVFSYFPVNKQVEMLTTQDRAEAASLVAMLPADDRVDLLQQLPKDPFEEILALLPAEERRDFLRLSQFPEGTAGAVMTSEMAKLSDKLTIREALDELAREGEDWETIYYIYIVDDEDHLRGLATARQLLVGMRKPETKLVDIMQTDLIAAHVLDDQEDVANKVARMDLLAIPVVDLERHLVGIITHDDIIDVVREEATEDAHRSAAVEPLDESYLQTGLLALSWKRGVWLTFLFFFALATAYALKQYDDRITTFRWLVAFIPLIISSGGNSGTQSATLIITALSRKHIALSDWVRVLRRELIMGLLLGVGLALLGYFASLLLIPMDAVNRDRAVFVVPLTLVLVVLAGTITGGILPLIFKRLGLDPAMMSNPFVAGIVDILGILIYVGVAWLLLGI
jgi:magnesium transporter